MGEYKLIPSTVVQAAVAELRRIADFGGGCDHSVGICWCDVYNLADQLAAAPSPEWIPVSERLPEIEDADENYDLWVWDGGTVCMTHYENAGMWDQWQAKPRVQPPQPPGGES